MGIPPPIYLDTISMPDTLILMVMALVVFGPRRLPKIGRQLGKLMYEFRKASNDFKFQMEEELRQSEEAERRQKEEEDRKRALAAAPPAPQLEQSTTIAAEPAVVTESELPAAPETDLYTYEQSRLRFPDDIPEGAGPADAGQPAANESAAATQPESTEPTATQTGLRVQPPSTGEKVAAERPGRQSALNEAADAPQSDAGAASEHVTPEAERSEPATHHG
jgi:sec-independent protein translocase protein TatB